MCLERGQPLLQQGSTDFTLTLGAVHLQGGFALPQGDSDRMLLTITHFDLHQAQGNVLNCQDNQL